MNTFFFIKQSKLIIISPTTQFRTQTSPPFQKLHSDSASEITFSFGDFETCFFIIPKEVDIFRVRLFFLLLFAAFVLFSLLLLLLLLAIVADDSWQLGLSVFDFVLSQLTTLFFRRCFVIGRLTRLESSLSLSWHSQESSLDSLQNLIKKYY